MEKKSQIQRKGCHDFTDRDTGVLFDLDRRELHYKPFEGLSTKDGRVYLYPSKTYESARDRADVVYLTSHVVAIKCYDTWLLWYIPAKSRWYWDKFHQNSPPSDAVLSNFKILTNHTTTCFYLAIEVLGWRKTVRRLTRDHNAFFGFGN